MTLQEAQWHVAQALAHIAAHEGVRANVIAIHHTHLRSANTVAVYLETDQPDVCHCGMPGLIAVAVDRHELESYSPDEALAILTGRNERKH